MNTKRTKTAIKAGSMADIAFLLLIFFLTTTSIYNDQGINTVLPPYYDGPPGQILEKNVAVIRINDVGKILFEKEEIAIDEIREKLIYFIENPDRRIDLPAEAADAIVSIQNDPFLSYEIYMNVYSEIKSAYHLLYNKFSARKFGKKFSSLEIKQQNEIRKLIPIKISEAEYTFQ